MTASSSSGNGGSGPRRPLPPPPPSDPAARPGAPRKQPRRRRGPGAIIALVLVGILAVVGGIAFQKLNRIGGGGSKGVKTLVDTFANPRAQFPDKSGRIYVLLIGKDYSYFWSRTNKKLSGSPYSSQSRSDSIMLLSLDIDHQKVSALSIPRDTWVTAPDGKTGKINGTYDRGGADLLEKTVAQVLGVTPDYYIAVKPDFVKTMVDRLGGVQVTALDSMEYNDAAAHLHIQIPPGSQTLDGMQAIGFARYRKPDEYQRNPDGTAIWTGRKDSEGNPLFERREHITLSKEDGDPRRMARQQQLIKAMAAKAKSPSNWLQIDGIVETALGQIETNLTRQQIFALVSLFRQVKPEDLESGTLPSRIVKGRYLLDDRKTEALVDWLLKGDETAADRITVVAVRNETAVRGAAHRVAEQLKAAGFDARPDTSTPRVTAAPAATVSPAGTTAAYAAAQNDLPQTRILYAKASAASRAQRIAQILGVAATQVSKQAPPSTSPGTAVVAPPTADSDDEDAPDVIVELGLDLASGPPSAVSAAAAPRSATTP